MPTKQTIKGRTVGNLTGIEPTKQRKSGSVVWLCHCQCGQEVLATVSEFNSQRRACPKCTYRPRHGMSNSQAYRAWAGMIQRCTNLKNPAFPNYGGRGIKVCSRWLIFTAFLEDMDLPPTSAHSIERRNNNGAYEPDNCYWATRKEQQRNRRGNRTLTLNGVTKTVVEWAETAQVQYAAIITRLNNGWSAEHALTFPLSTKRYRTRIA